MITCMGLPKRGVSFWQRLGRAGLWDPLQLGESVLSWSYLFGLSIQGVSDEILLIGIILCPLSDDLLMLWSDDNTLSSKGEARSLLFSLRKRNQKTKE